MWKGAKLVKTAKEATVPPLGRAAFEETKRNSINKDMKGSNNTIISDSLVADVRAIIEDGRQRAYAAAGRIALQTYWDIGRRIVEEEQQGNSRTDYGKRLIPALADMLTIKYGSGYSKRNLAYYRKFYLEFKDTEILHTLVQNLNWSHIRRLLSVSNPQAREWYLKTASTCMSECTTTWLRAPMMPQLLEFCFALIPTRQLPAIRCCMTTNSCMQQNI